MAIANMKKMTLIALKNDHNSILKALQQSGTVHIIEGNTDNTLVKFSEGQNIEIEQKLLEIRNTLLFLKKYDKSKKSLLKAKPAITAEKLNGVIVYEEKAQSIIQAAKSIEDKLIVLRSQKTRLINKINALKPYLKLDMPIEMVKDTQNTKVYLGVINSNAQSMLVEILQKYDGLAYVETLDTVLEYVSIFAVAHESIANEFFNDLKTAYFSEFSFGDYTGTPAQITADLEKESALTDAEAAETEAETAGLIEDMDTLYSLEDYYATELERARAVDLLCGTEKTFVLEGWVIVCNEKKAEDAVARVTDKYYADFREPYEDEQFPVALVNNRLLRPYEGIIEMYSLPQPRGIDATALIAPFYFIFYGMMVSDAGYGIVLTLFALFLLKVQKPSGMFRKILGVITMTGISTLIWGSLYGGWFGFSLPPLWFNPMEQPMTMLILCLGIGFIHVFTGLLIGAVMAFKRGKWVDAVCDKILWMMLFAGLPMLAFGGLLSAIGTYLSLVGAAGIVFTNGRSKKGILKKLVGGLGALYGVSGFLSDVLSYSRLFGMGLATSVIAMVFNTIAGLLTGSVIGWPFAAAIFLVGHIFNIGINALGAYVHSSRLMYIEYFSKFYEDGGKPFKPLAFRIKHYRLEN